jgi:hypothetical protein
MSPCGKYRYRLERVLVDGPRRAGNRVNFIMLNPSTADATHNDPTIIRVQQFARRFGFEELVVTNLFALRATNPAQLRTAEDPCGPDNESHLVLAALESRLVILAWGNSGALGGAGQSVRLLLASLGMTDKLSRLGSVTKAGQPRHPLYLPSTTEIEDWKGSLFNQRYSTHV